MTGLAIIGHTIRSRFGTGTDALLDALSRPADATPLATDFDLRGELSGKGTRSMDRATGLAVTAVADLLDATGPRPRPERTAVVLGTSYGSAETSLSFVRSSLSRPKPYLVDPGRFPVTIMNYAAGQCAIRHGLTGPNTTIAGGRTAMPLVLQYARRLLVAGRADDVLCGVTEELTPERAALERRDPPTGIPVSEGCVMLHVRRPAYDLAVPRVSAVATVLARPGGNTEAVRTCVTRALRQAGAFPSDVWAVATSGALDGTGAAEAAGLNEALGVPGPRRVAVHRHLGDTSAASGGFALVTLLAMAARDDAPDGSALLVTSLDPNGVAACVVLGGSP
ncbi:beta-ketoacyl synthase N-terminal-like domain-containing protein [Stackebrandtia soli]|uniref:beta-ketoacyl synthase N-terminal-like domain-containing protein n=1 Tax=Stackebrandtia soli TaxID=1892856 RepID=UPI0039EAC91C